VNTLADVYGYLRFLKIRPWYDWTEFQKEVGIHEKKNRKWRLRPGPQSIDARNFTAALAVTRLQTIMHTFLLRRKKDSMLDGKKLIDLPEKEVKLIKLEFSEEERDIYQMVEARSQAKFNRYLRAGTVLKYGISLRLRRSWNLIYIF
jgi:SNF2 family DNA or RNA helicase